MELITDDEMKTDDVPVICPAMSTVAWASDEASAVVTEELPVSVDEDVALALSVTELPEMTAPESISRLAFDDAVPIDVAAKLITPPPVIC